MYIVVVLRHNARDESLLFCLCNKCVYYINVQRQVWFISLADELGVCR